MFKQSKTEDIYSVIQEVLSDYKGTISQVDNDEIVIEIENLPYSFVISRFQSFGWQVFLMPKEKIIEDNLSDTLYHHLHLIVTTYNSQLNIQEASLPFIQ